jgi:hypothetical protein
MRALRLPLAALAGAAAMFAWSALSHTALIRGIGFTPLPDEDAVLTELRKHVKDDGLYFFPGVDWGAKATPEQTASWQARFRTGNGLIVFHPSSDAPVSPRKLGLQFLGDLLASLLAAWLVSLLPSPYWKRLLAVGAMGAFGCLGVSALFWNWYGFPHAFFAAHAFDKIVGWLIAGAAIAALAPGSAIRRQKTAPGADR